MTSYNNTIGLPAVHTSQGVTNQYNVALSSYFNGSYPFTPNMGFVNFQQSNMAESISHPIPLYSAQPNNLGYVYLQSGLGHYCPSPAQPASYMTHPQANLVSSVPIQPAQVQPQPAQVQPQPAQIPIQQAHPYSSSQAFQTMTLQEPNWNMDTRASSHLDENTGMLTSFSNPSLYKSVFVGNGQPILVTHTGHSLGIDCDETFSLVVKLDTIRTILSLAVTRDCPIHQLDVKNAFLHGQLSETVYMHQPSGFVDSTHPDYVCHLQRSLYRLKQAPRA
ncbi:ribonuclease H-like domain-containing protein [Tanacetum coccineum]